MSTPSFVSIKTIFLFELLVKSLKEARFFSRVSTLFHLLDRTDLENAITSFVIGVGVDAPAVTATVYRIH